MANLLLSKIQIGTEVYDLKDAAAREGLAQLGLDLEALAALVGDVEEGQNLADLLAALAEEHAGDVQTINGLIEALQAEDLKKADKEQVAKDIEAAVKAEADIARAAEKANADEIARVDAALKAAVENDGEGLDSIKELATWIEEHGPEAKAMSEAITANAEAIAAMDEAYKAADEATDARLDVIEEILGEGEGSVADQIADAKAEAIEAAGDYTDEREVEITKAYKAADKEIVDALGDLAYADAVTVTVPAHTVSGQKATGAATASTTLTTENVTRDVSITANCTAEGTVAGTVVANGDVDVTVSGTSAEATVSRGDYTPAGSVSGHLTNNTFKAVTSAGTAASFVEGTYTPASLGYEAVTGNYATEGIVASVSGETLTFTDAGIAALTASKINSWTAGSKAADTFTPNVPATVADHTVGMSDLVFNGTKETGLKVDAVTYTKTDSASATFTGKTADINATFTGSSATVNATGSFQDVAVTGATTTVDALSLDVSSVTIDAATITGTKAE